MTNRSIPKVTTQKIQTGKKFRLRPIICEKMTDIGRIVLVGNGRS